MDSIVIILANVHHMDPVAAAACLPYSIAGNMLATGKNATGSRPTALTCLHFVFGKVGRIQGEIPVAIHVVNISPHDFQGDVGSLVFGNHFRQLLHMLVPPPAPHLNPFLQSHCCCSCNSRWCLMHCFVTERAPEHVSMQTLTWLLGRNVSNMSTVKRLCLFMPCKAWTDRVSD